MYTIDGGVHTDTTFTSVISGTEEFYGPFETYEEAKKVWLGRMMKKVDDCEHRLFIRVISDGPIIRVSHLVVGDRTVLSDWTKGDDHTIIAGGRIAADTIRVG